MDNNKPVAILGGGIAGLTAAKFLHRNNIPSVVYEAGNKIGGLATTFKDKEGFSYDFGAHFITNRLAAAIGVSADCSLVKYYGESVLLNDKYYKYPFGLLKIPRMITSGIKSQLQKKTSCNAAEWFRNKYGTALANEVAIPLIEAWSGAPADQLSPAVGESLPGSIGKTLFLKLAGKILHRAVACGYNREMPEKVSVWHVYPNNGVSQLCYKLAEGLESNIKLQSPIQEIIVKNNKVFGVCSKGDLQEVSAVISTAPVHILSKLVKGSNALKSVSKFRYRPMIFVNIRLEGRHLLPDTVLWFPEKKFPFFRLTEAPISMPWLAPAGKTIITVDFGCNVGDEFWAMDDQKLTELCLKNLFQLIPDINKRFLASNSIRTPIAYPVFLNEYEKERQEFEKSTNVENLISIGRNGEFSHIFMEDVYWRSLKKTRQLVKNIGFD